MAGGDWAAMIGVVGGVIGLFGGLMSFRDRFYKGRPVASLTTNNSSGRTLVQVRIKNTTEYDVVVNGGTERRGVYFLAEDFGTGALVRGQIKGGMFSPFVLKPGDSRELFIMPKFKNNVAIEATGNRYIEFWIHWRRGNATWLPQIPVPVCTNTKTIRQLGGVE
jgi:hypothetical protein